MSFERNSDSILLMKLIILTDALFSDSCVYMTHVLNVRFISKFSDQELEASLLKYRYYERRVLHIVLEHIREIDNRRLYLGRGFDSTISYLVKVHGYSRTAAEQRLYAARMSQVVPEISEKIKNGTLHLSQVCQLSSAIKQKERLIKAELSVEEKRDLVSRIDNKTGWETQKELAVALDISLKPQETQIPQKDDSVHLSLTLSKNQYELLMNCRDKGFQLLQNNHDHSIAGLIEVLCQQYLRNKSVKVVNSNVEVTENLKTRNPDLVSTASQDRNANKRKALTPRLRKFILSRDRCCQFVDKNTGIICESTVGLQVDHIIPVWAGGDNGLKNLRTLCGIHNRYKYKMENSIRNK